MLLVRDTCHNLFPRDRYPHTWLCHTPHQFMATLKFDADHPDSDLSHEYKVDLSHFCLMKYEIPNTIHFISICLTCIVDRRQMYINGKVQTIKHVWRLWTCLGFGVVTWSDNLSWHKEWRNTLRSASMFCSEKLWCSECKWYLIQHHIMTNVVQVKWIAPSPGVWPPSFVTLITAGIRVTQHSLDTGFATNLPWTSWTKWFLAWVPKSESLSVS